MLARKYLLVIAAEDGDLAPAISSLADEFEVTRADSQESGLEQIKTNPSISLVAVEGRLVDQAQAFLAKVKDLHRDMPVIWAKAANDASPFKGERPDAMMDFPLDGAAFEEQAKKLLSDDSYPKSVLAGLRSSANGVMAASFDIAVDAGEPWLKQTEGLPGEVHAFLPFMSGEVLGHLMVSGGQETLICLGEQLGFEREDGERQVSMDVAGEIGNQVLGRMKTICGDLLKGVRMGLPAIFIGPSIQAHFSSSRPNLCVELDIEFGTVHVELGFQQVKVDDPNAGTEGLMDAGELELF